MELDDIARILRTCQVFGELSDDELNSIAKLCEVERFGAGETVYSQGSVGEKLYVLSEGQVSLERTVDIGDRGKATITVFTHKATPLRRLMGGWSAILGVEHIQMCSAVCYLPTTVISMECSKLRETIDKNLAIKAKILEKLVLMLRDRIDSSYKAMETL
jgi:CRP-like cAMP-binding protein